MFKITNLKREFMSANNQKKAVLGDISIDINPHDFISIVGPSGCGKTTFLRILAGFDKEYDGSITYSPGENGTFKEIELLGNVGFVPQEPSLFPWLTVEDNIAFGLRMQKTEDKEIEKVIAPLIDLVGLGNFRKYYPKEISGGMRQKVAICRALATNPKTNLILLDEPFSALDAQTRNTLQTDLLKIWEERNLTILFVFIILMRRIHEFTNNDVFTVACKDNRKFTKWISISHEIEQSELIISVKVWNHCKKYLN